MSLATLESCITTITRQTRQIRAQRRPRPNHLQLRIDQLLWRCCRELPLDRFQEVFETIADPLSDLHVLIRNQAMMKHGQIAGLLSSLQNCHIQQQSVLQLMSWSSRLQDLSLFYRIWTQQSRVIKQNPEAVWKLAIALSSRQGNQPEYTDVLADVLAVLTNQGSDYGDRLAHLLYDCILRYSSNAGFKAGAGLCKSLQEKMGSNHFMTELGLLLIKDKRCCRNEHFVRQCIHFFIPLLTGQISQHEQRILRSLQSVGLLNEVLSVVRDPTLRVSVKRS